MYIDVYFVVNWLLNGWILSCAVSSCFVPRWRIWLAAAAGAMGACFWEVLDAPSICRPAGALFLAALMVWLCIGQRPRQQWTRVLFRLYAYGFLMAGLIPAASRHIPLWIGSVAVSYLGLKVFLRIMTSKEKRRVSLTIMQGEHQWQLSGLSDSGNLLRDPIKGCPVIIVNEESLAERPAADWPILYRTIQGEGLMMGFWPERVQVDGSEFKKGEVVIGIAKEWKEAGYEAIIPEILK